MPISALSFISSLSVFIRVNPWFQTGSFQGGGMCYPVGYFLENFFFCLFAGALGFGYNEVYFRN